MTTSIENTFSKTMAELGEALFGPESEKELDFYLSQFLPERPLSGKTLDIGCGTGRFLIPLLKRGYGGLGLDPSGGMLEVLKKKAAASGLDPEILPESFENFDGNEEFQGITALFVIFFLTKTEELRGFFQKAFKLLTPGGVFMVNYFNLYQLWQPKPWSYTNAAAFDGGFGRLECSYTPVDYLRGVVSMQDYAMLCKNGEAAFDFSVRPIRYYSMMEITLLLEEAGFTSVRTHADMSPQPVSDMDSRGFTLYTVAKKP